MEQVTLRRFSFLALRMSCILQLASESKAMDTSLIPPSPFSFPLIKALNVVQVELCSDSRTESSREHGWPLSPAVRAAPRRVHPHLHCILGRKVAQSASYS